MGFKDDNCNHGLHLIKHAVAACFAMEPVHGYAVELVPAPE